MRPVDTSNTLAARLRCAATADSPPCPDVVVFNSYRPPVESSRSSRVTSDSTRSQKRPQPATAGSNPEEVSLSRVRHDVFQLGVSGMSRERRLAARQLKLVQLGAKPAAPQSVGYPQLMAQLQQRRSQQLLKREQAAKEGDGRRPAVQAKYRKRRDKNTVRGSLSGQPGRYSSGVQRVDSASLLK